MVRLAPSVEPQGRLAVGEDRVGIGSTLQVSPSATSG